MVCSAYPTPPAAPPPRRRRHSVPHRRPQWMRRELGSPLAVGDMAERQPVAQALDADGDQADAGPRCRARAAVADARAWALAVRGSRGWSGSCQGGLVGRLELLPWDRAATARPAAVDDDDLAEHGAWATREHQAGPRRRQADDERYYQLRVGTVGYHGHPVRSRLRGSPYRRRSRFVYPDGLRSELSRHKEQPDRWK
jgi:hypothetical protein